MANADDLERALNAFKTMIYKHTVLVDALVTDVNLGAFTCDVSVNDVDYTNVPLKVLKQSSASLIEIPKVNTYVLISFRDANLQSPQIISVHECQKITIIIGSSQLDITNGLFEFNGGSNGGMVLVNQLVSAYNNVATDMIAIAAALSALGHPIVPTTTIKTSSFFENTNITQ